MLQLNTHFRLCCRAKRDGEVRNQKKKPKKQHSQTATSSFVGDFFSPSRPLFLSSFLFSFLHLSWNIKGCFQKSMRTWKLGRKFSHSPFLSSHKLTFVLYVTSIIKLSTGGTFSYASALNIVHVNLLREIVS